MTNAAEIRDQITLAADEGLRPKDRRVFSLLAQWAIERPGEFLSMAQIADAGWQTALDDLQIKNNVQRSIYEIRQRFGRDVVQRDGNGYRLDFSELENRFRRQLQRENPTDESSQRLTSAFTQRLGTVLSRATQTPALNQLLFWGQDALLGLLEHSGSLYELIRCQRALHVGVGATEGRLAVDVVKSVLYSTEGISFDELHRQSAGCFQISVIRACMSSGLCWLDYRPEESFVDQVGLGGDTVRVAEGAQCLSVQLNFARSFLTSKSPNRSLIVVDSQDRTLEGLVERLRQYCSVDTSEARILPELLIDYAG